MNKNGGYTWLQTCATVVCSSKNDNEQNIICVNYVVSNRENENLILDCIQMENGLEHIIKHEDLTGDNGTGSPGNDPNDANSAANRSADHLHKLPKSETPETSGTRRNRSTTNTSITNMAMENSLGTISSEHLTPLASGTGATRKGHKRKAKHIDVNEGPLCDSKVNGVAMNMPTVDGIDEHAETSVKDLEHAMSKHLPSPINNNNNNSNNNNNTTTDFSTDSLLKQQQDKGSTIQWIGAHHNPFHQQAAPMPATALLRQLYANRESVIRATARQSSGGVYYPGESSSGLFPYFAWI